MLRTGPLLRFRDPEEMTVQDLPSSWGAGMGATLGESFMGSPGPLLFRELRRGFYRPGGIAGGGLPDDVQAEIAQQLGIKMLSADEANSKYAIGDLAFENPISETEAIDLYETQKAMLRRMDIIRRSEIGGFEKFVASLGGALLDPMNIAAGYFTSAKIGWSARSATVSGRLAFGATESAIAGVPLAGVTYGLSAAEQRPYSLADAFLDVTFGSLLGAGLHVGIGAYKDWRKGAGNLSPIEQTLEGATPQERVQLLRGAVADVLEGRPVGVGPLVQLAAREYAIREFFRLRKAGDRLTAEDSAALAQMLGVEEKLVPQIEALSRRIFELEQERASVAARRGEIARDLAPDEVTADRLAAIDTELATPNLPVNRRDALRAERTMLTEGADTAEGSLTTLRSLSEERGLAKAEKRAGLRLESTEKARRLTAAELKRARDDFRRFSGRSASRASTVQAMAERVLRRAAADMKATVDQAALAAAARRVLQAKDPVAQIKAELDAMAAQTATAAPEGTTVDAEATPLGEVETDRMPSDQAANPTAERRALQAGVAKRQAQEHYDPQDEAVSAEIDETIEATPSFRKREADEPIGASTQAVEELKELDAETTAQIAEMKRLGLLTEGEENALAEAGEAVSLAQATAKVRDMAAMCLASMPEGA